MLPIFTTEQVKDGIAGDLLIDLSDYMKKKDGATKAEVDSLSAVVAGKLDATPQHKHDISDVKDLQEELDSKYDTSKQYSYNTILSDSEKIPYLESPKMELFEIVKDKNSNGYTFYVDDANDDLMITYDGVLIGSYSKTSGKWALNGIEQGAAINHTHSEYSLTGHQHEEYATKIGNIETNVSTLQTTTNAVLENHAEALNAVCNATLKNITDIAQHTHTQFNNLTVDGNLNVGGTLNGHRIGTMSQVGNYKAATFIPTVGNDGVLEVGKFIDFHEYTDASGENHDYKVRLESNQGQLVTNGNLMVKGNLTANNVDILAKITEMETILKNHYDALLLLCEKHGMVDSNTKDGNNISPK